MSLLFNLTANLSVGEEDKACFFTSTPHKQAPYMILEGDKVVGESSLEEPEKIIMKFKLFDLCKEEIKEVIHKTFPKLLYEESRVLGSSRGWIAFMSKHDGTVYLSDVFNLLSPRVITLPSLASTLLKTSPITNVSISSLPDKDNGYLVFLKFLFLGFYYCRPNRDSRWTRIDIFGCNLNSCDVIYSSRNQMLLALTVGAGFLVSFDLNMEIRYTKLHLRNYPNMSRKEWEFLALGFKTEHLVESSCGKCFVVRQCVETYDKGDRDMIFNKTKSFMVFRLDKKVKSGEINAKYTQNIGDLCIFIGSNETFCVDATKYLGLKPNSIYYIGYGIGVYDISSKKFNRFTPSMPLNWPLCLLPEPHV